MSKPKINEYHYHELLDRTHTICLMIDQLLLDHPALEHDPEWAGMASIAYEEIMNLYQEVGKVHLSEDSKDA